VHHVVVGEAAAEVRDIAFDDDGARLAARRPGAEVKEIGRSGSTGSTQPPAVTVASELAGGQSGKASKTDNSLDALLRTRRTCWQLPMASDR